MAAATEKEAPRKSIGATVVGVANDIAERLEKVQERWLYLGAKPKLAMEYADKEYFVIGWLARPPARATSSSWCLGTVQGGDCRRPGATRSSRGGAPMIYHGSALVKLRSTMPTQVDIFFSRPKRSW